MSVTLAATDDRALFELLPILDAVRYRVRLFWNDRELAWICSMSMVDGTRLFDGRAVRVGENLLGQWLDSRLPPGALIVIDTSGEDLDPDRDAFANGRCRIVYLTLAEVRALRAAAIAAAAT